MARKSLAVRECRRCKNTISGSHCSSCGLWNIPGGKALTGYKTLADIMPGKEVAVISCGRWGWTFSAKGGLVPGTVTALGGSPGAGKSTLLLHIIGCLDEKSVYVLAEEGEEPVKERADRLGIEVEKQRNVTPILALGNEEFDIASVMNSLKAKVLFVDSISLLAGDPATAVAYCQYLKMLAAKHNIAVVLTVHVTKDGGIAGLMALQHVVDCTMTFFPDETQKGIPRILHVEKNRNGPAYVSQTFLMKEKGLEIVREQNAMEQLEN